MVVHGVKQRNHRVVGVGSLDLVRVPLVETELTIPAHKIVISFKTYRISSSVCYLPCSVVRMIFTAFIIFILHKVKISEDRNNVIGVLSS